MKRIHWVKAMYGVMFLCTVTAIAATPTFRSLASFNGSNGEFPYASLVQGTDGNFYGTTNFDGGSVCGGVGCGTVYKITPQGKLTILHYFAGYDGGNPIGALILGADGDFYGTAQNGGANNYGTVFKMTAAGQVTLLYSFCSETNCSDGAYPSGALVEGTDGNFYGTTQGGYDLATGAMSYGTIFMITPKGKLTTLYAFCPTGGACPNGELPYAGLTLASPVPSSGQIFYGTTFGGGAGDDGTAFSFTPSGSAGTLETYVLDADGASGTSPYYGPLVAGSNGYLYGTTELGGGLGGTSTITSTISGGFSSAVTLSASGAPSSVYAGFVPDPIAAPGSGISALTLTANSSTPVGTYNVTVTGTGGGLTRTTTVLLTTPGPTFTLSASPTSVAVNPGSSGTSTITSAIYGGFSSAVALSASGMPSGVTASFSPPSIPSPGSGSSVLTLSASTSAPTGIYSVLISGSGGGVTQTAPVSLTVGPTFTLIASPTSVAVSPGSNGTSTVTTAVSGGFSSAIALTASGLPSGVTAGFNPSTIPAPGSGSSTLTLTVGSSAAVGTYSITITGAGGGVTQATPVSLTVGPNFTLAACPGSVPLSLGNAGRAFSLQPPTTQSPCWALIPLYGFCSEANCTDGSNPKGGLVLGSDGNLYGTTNYGGTYGSYGTVFRINLGSTPTEFETLYNFCMLTGCTDGRLPISGLVQGTNGIFYGTTSEGGQYDEGEVFELTVPGVPAFVRTVPTVAAPGASVTVLGNNLKGATSVTFNGTPVASFKVNKTGTAISTEVPAGANSGPVEVVTSSGTTLSSIVSFQVLQ